MALAVAALHSLAVARINAFDPTQTTTIRRAYEAEAVQRFKTVRALIIRAVDKEDVFGLRNPDIKILADTPGRKAYDFPLETTKINKFNDWLEKTVDDEILDLRMEAAAEGITAANWQSKHVQRAYTKGAAVAKARAESLAPDAPIRTLEQIINSPFNQDRMQSLFARNFQELKGVTRAMDQQISRELSEGLAQGIGPKELARRLADRVNKIGITRARTIARTEVIRANAEATLTTFEQLEVTQVTIQAEFKTVGDDLVCVQCEDLEGEIFSIKEARGLIPQHPNCRCTWLPITRKCKSPCVTGKDPLSARTEEPDSTPGDLPLGERPSHVDQLEFFNERFDHDFGDLNEVNKLQDTLDEWDREANTNFVDFERSWVDGIKDFLPSGAEIKTKIELIGEGFGGEGNLYRIVTQSLGETGDQLLFMNRLLDFDTRSVKMETFRIAKELTGRGIGKLILRNQQRLFEHIGMNKMILEADINVGGYAWAKYGYVPDIDSWNELREKFQFIFQDLTPAQLRRFAPDTILKNKAWKQLGNTAKELIDRILDNPDPKSMWMFADIQNKVKVALRGGGLSAAEAVGVGAGHPARQDFVARSMAFGKRMLLGEGWFGELDFSDAKAMKRFKAYIAPAIKPARKPLAIVAPSVPKRPLVAKDWINKAIKNAEEEFSIAAGRAKMSVRDFKRAVNKKMRQLTQEADLFVRVPEDVMEDILGSRSIKSQFETGTSRGVLGDDFRAWQEQNMFGLSVNHPPEARPIYGYLAPRKAGPFAPTAGSVDAYGDVAIKLKSGVKSRTTMTIGDSLGFGPIDDAARARGSRLAPSRVNAPQHHSVLWSDINARGGRDVLEFDDIGDFLGGAIDRETGLILKTRPKDPFHLIGPGGEFTEAQIHRGVSLKDIDEVIFEGAIVGEEGTQGVFLRRQLVQTLDNEGIDWSVQGGGPAFKITPKTPKKEIFTVGNKAPDLVTWQESLSTERADEVGRVFKDFTEGSYKNIRAVERGEDFIELVEANTGLRQRRALSSVAIDQSKKDLEIINEAFRKVKPFHEGSIPGGIAPGGRNFADGWRAATSEISFADGLEDAYEAGTFFELESTASFSLDEHTAISYLDRLPPFDPDVDNPLIIYRLRTKSGLLIEDLAALPDEREMLIKKGTRFKVQNSRLVNFPDEASFGGIRGVDDVMFVEAVEVGAGEDAVVSRFFSGPPEGIPRSRGYGTRSGFDDVTSGVPPLPARAVPRTAANRITRQELLTMDFEVVDSVGGGSNVVELVILEDGTPAIWKPGFGESDSLRGWVDGDELYRRENLASQVADLTGTDDLVMRSVIRVDPQDESAFGSLIEFVDGEIADSFLSPRPESISLEEFTEELITSMGATRGDAERAAVFDLITGQMDRHGANWVLKDGKMVLIDNALMMPSEIRSRLDGSTFVSRFKSTIGGPVTREVVESWDNAWDDLLVAFEEAGMSKDAVDGARQRLDMLLTERLQWEDISETYLSDSFLEPAVAAAETAVDASIAAEEAAAAAQAEVAARDAAILADELGIASGEEVGIVKLAEKEDEVHDFLGNWVGDFHREIKAVDEDVPSFVPTFINEGEDLVLDGLATKAPEHLFVNEFSGDSVTVESLTQQVDKVRKNWGIIEKFTGKAFRGGTMSEIKMETIIENFEERGDVDPNFGFGNVFTSFTTNERTAIGFTRPGRGFPHEGVSVLFEVRAEGFKGVDISDFNVLGGEDEVLFLDAKFRVRDVIDGEDEFGNRLVRIVMEEGFNFSFGE